MKNKDLKVIIFPAHMFYRARMITRTVWFQHHSNINGQEIYRNEKRILKEPKYIIQNAKKGRIHGILIRI